MIRDAFRKCAVCGQHHWLSAWPEGHDAPEPERSVFPMPQVMRDTPEYRSPLGTGLITSRSQRREDLKRGDCREVDPSEYKHPPVKPRRKWLERQKTLS